MALETAMSTAEGPGDVDTSPTPTAWKRWLGKGVSRTTLSIIGQLAKSPPLVIDHVGIHDMSCPAVEDCLFEDCAVDTGGTEASVELPLKTRRVYDLTHVGGIHHTDQVYLSGLRIDLNLHKAHHAVAHGKIRLKTAIAEYGPVVSHGPPFHVLFRMVFHKDDAVGGIQVFRGSAKLGRSQFKESVVFASSAALMTALPMA